MNPPTNSPSPNGPGASAEVQPHLALYWSLVLATACLYIAALITAVFSWTMPIFSFTGEYFTFGPGLLLGALVHFVLSIKSVEADKVAGLFFYGKALHKAEPGPHFVPLGLMQLRKESRAFQEFQFPGDPEKVFHGDDKVDLPEGMVRPIRVVTRSPKDTEKEHLDVQMTLVVNFVVQFRVVNIFDFVANIGTLKEAERQMRDAGETTLAEAITIRTAGQVVTGLSDINSLLEDAIQKRIEGWGVEMISARMVAPDITHDVSIALANIPIARAQAEKTVIDARATRAKLTEEGQGAADAREALLTGEAKGLEAQKKLLGLANGETVLAAQVAQAVVGNEKTILIGGESGMKDVMAIVKGAEAALKPKAVAPGDGK
ncbi:MAG TPA: SPFH domain-containing protein [Candidatus Paceibacterota bacterium]|nr:SPFH domain-containing protein [Candidatus Paceibacterota bacterium]